MITQRQRWVPGPPRRRFFRLWTGGSENALLGSSEAPFVPFHSAISHGVLGALAVGNFGLGLIHEPGRPQEIALAAFDGFTLTAALGDPQGEVQQL